MINPVLAKELRDRVRTWRSPMLITFYLGLLATAGGVVFFMETRFVAYGPAILRLGVQIFSIQALLQLLLIAFLTPGMTAGIISGERERQTFPLLLVTKLSAFSVVTGKLFSAISYILLLVIASLPIYSMVFLFGGADVREFLQVAGVLLATTVTLGSIGIFCSALFKRTTVAIVVSYFVTFVLVVGTVVFNQIVQAFRVPAVNGMPPEPSFVVYFNPLVAMASGLPSGQSYIPFRSGNIPSVPYWLGNMVLDAGIIALCLALTVWFVRPLRKGTKAK